MRVYYAKLAGGRSMFVALALISHFAAIWMPRRKDEPLVLSVPAQRVLKVLRREHELATADLRANRVEAGSGNHQLVDEGYAIGLRQGIYALASMKNSLANDYRAA